MGMGTQGPPLDPLFEESLAWLALLRSDRLTPEERYAFDRWRAMSAAHAAAFSRAERFGDKVRLAGRSVMAQAAHPEVVRPFPSPPVTRRVMMGGALAASLVAVAIGARQIELIADPLGGGADFATATGERRTVRLAQGLDLELDVQTAVNVTASGDRHMVDLKRGRAEVVASLPRGHLALTAGAGTVLARRASFDARNDGGEACITCTAGAIRLDHPQRSVDLSAGEQVTYAGQRIDAVRRVDLAVATAWREGKLIFRRTPLAEVVREINRYRKGEVILANRAIGSAPINGVFDIARVDSAVAQLADIGGASLTRLPGGIIVLN